MRRVLSLLAVLLAVSGCESEGPVQFGAVLPLTGSYELYGQAIRKGVELAMEEIAGRKGYPFEVAIEIVDSAGDPATASELLSELYGNGALAAIGGVTTAEALQMVPVADRYDRVLISPSASSPELTGISKNFYRVFPSDSREGTTMGNFASRKLKLETVVILSQESPYAKGIQDVFKTEFERNQGQVLDLIEYPPGAVDVTGFIDRVLTLDPQAVYVAAYAEDVARMIELMRRKGYKGTILTTAAFALPEVIERVGGAAEGVYMTRAVFEETSEDPAVQRFVSAYRQKFNLAPDLYAAHGYDAMMILAESLQESGSRFASDFWKGVRAIRDYPGVTGTIQFDEKGDAQKFPRVYVVDSGNLVDYENEVERRRRELLQRLRELEERRRGQAEG